MKLFILVTGCCLLFTGCSGLNESCGLEDDHICEEILEQLIESQTMIDIDLTPTSPENQS